MRNEACPERRSLPAFAVGDLSGAELDELATHLDGCSSCAERLDEIDGHEDGLIRTLRLAASSVDESPVRCPPEFVRRARAAFDSSGDGSSRTAVFDAGRRLAVALESGPVRLGRFELRRELGVGSFGHVFLAVDVDLRREVAIKVLRGRPGDSAEEEERFRREAQSVARLDDPRIVSLYEVGRTEDGVQYLVTEFVDGRTLDRVIEEARPGPDDAARLVAEIAEALHVAHERGVIHRDVKPSNVLIDGGGAPHVMDFGLARREQGDVTLTPTGEIMGTPAYMSPELARGDAHRVDRRADVYALGVVLYELLTGERPFQGNRRMLMLQVLEDEPRAPRRLDPGIPRDLETICLKALEKPRAARYATAHALAADLKRYLARSPIEARRVGPLGRLVRWCRRNPPAASLIAALLGFTLLGFFHLTSLSRHLIESAAVDSATQYAALLEVVNDAYASEVVQRVGHHGVEATADYATREGAIPLPATFLSELLERVSRTGTGMMGRHYSEFPFRSRRDGGAKDEFGRRALAWLDVNPSGSYTRVEELEGRVVLRLARARIMKESCVACHNTHADSTKLDWEVGDVRGALEIIRPLDADEDRIEAGLRLTFVLSGAAAVLLFGLVLGLAAFGQPRGPRA